MQGGCCCLAVICPEAKFMKVQFWFLGIILRVLRLEVSAYNVYITNHFQTTSAGGVTVNSMEENSSDFCPNYVQEFGLPDCSTP
jgi:hypothetical protein